MGKVAAQAGLPGWAGPRELGGPQQTPFFLMIRGTDLQGLLLCPLVAIEGSVFCVFVVPMSRSFVSSLLGLGLGGYRWGVALLHGCFVFRIDFY